LRAGFGCRLDLHRVVGGKSQIAQPDHEQGKERQDQSELDNRRATRR
jgi:hypothetical protein